MKLPNLTWSYPEPRRRNHACPGWLLDRWDSAERKSVGSEISYAHLIGTDFSRFLGCLVRPLPYNRSGIRPMDRLGCIST
jgi:hypothetical protein